MSLRSYSQGWHVLMALATPPTTTTTDKVTHPTGSVVSGLNRCHSFLLARMTHQLAKHLKILSMTVMRGMKALLGDNTARSPLSLTFCFVLSCSWQFWGWSSSWFHWAALQSLYPWPAHLVCLCLWLICFPLHRVHISVFLFFSTCHPLWCVCVCVRMCVHVCVAV